MGRAALSPQRIEPARKPSESQKRKPFLWAMKAAWDRGKDFYDPTRKEDVSGRTQTRLELREEHLKVPMAALLLGLAFGSTVRRCQPLSGKGPVGKASGLTWTRGMLWVCAQRLASGTFRGSMGLMTSSFSSSLRRSLKGSAVQALCSCGDAQVMLWQQEVNLGPLHLLVSFHRSWERSVERSFLLRK